MLIIVIIVIMLIIVIIMKKMASTTTLNEDDKEKGDFYRFEISKSLGDKIMSIGKDIILEGVNTIAPNFGVGAAASAAAVGVFKATSGVPLGQRMILLRATTTVIAIGSKVGLDLGTSISRNMDLTDAIKNSKHGNVDPDKIPSPDGDEIRCPLEQGDMLSPLEEILRSQLTLNILILILVIIFLILIFNRYVLKFNLNMITKFNDRYVADKYKYLIINYTSKGLDFNSKFIFIMFIINTIFILLLLLLNIYISLELSNNTENYVQVYNHLHNK